MNNTTPKERPILFNGDMVRAILDGRKTQTRRALKPKTLEKLECAARIGECMPLESDIQDWDYFYSFCPYGKPGDRLWVRETFRPIVGQSGRVIEYSYRATPEGRPGDGIEPWKPSIFMPRAASRITLEITDVRVERLQDISEEDAKAEGVGPILGGYRCYDGSRKGFFSCAVNSFDSLWSSINGPDSWDANPWVWVVEFKRVDQ